MPLSSHRRFFHELSTYSITYTESVNMSCPSVSFDQIDDLVSIRNSTISQQKKMAFSQVTCFFTFHLWLRENILKRRVKFSATKISFE